jgi:sugar lactone lactonase YvrE
MAPYQNSIPNFARERTPSGANRAIGQRTKYTAALLVWFVGATLMLPLARQTAVAGPVVPLQISTSPSNGDLNPYGLINVPRGFPAGSISKGQLLVSNFNDTANVQGKGTTIIAVDPKSGNTSLFFEGTPGTPLGFSNALTVAVAGFVFAGSVPTSDPQGTMPEPGALLVLDNQGHLVTQLSQSDKINGPWGMAINDQGDHAQLFVSNVLDGTITRLEVSFQGGNFSIVGSPLTIAHGYGFGLDQTAVVVGPAGLAYDGESDTLYVASELDNEIFSLRGAGKTTSDLGTGDVVFSDSTHLRGPLGLILATNGHLITANADPSSVTPSISSAGPSEIVEFTKHGHFVRTFSIDSASGSAFAINELSKKEAIQFSYVDDAEATLTIWRLAD